MKLVKRLVIVLLSGFMLLSVVTGCRASSSEPISQNGFYFDTAITITLYDNENPEILDKCFALCSEYEQLLSVTINDSDVSKINQAAGAPVKADPRTIELLNQAIRFSELSDGAFDCTIAPLSGLWDFHAEKPALPDQEALETALKSVDYRQIDISGDTVTLKNPDMAIDLGGIAKGYIADRLKEYLLSENVSSALINLGGNVLAVGSKSGNEPFTIGIQRPFDTGGTPIATVSVKDRSMVTSGVYERCFELDGVLYHHLLDPSTGYPFDNGLYSVTILTGSSTKADALSTACFGLGLEKGMALIESLEDVEALFVTDTYDVLSSSGFPLS